jgi:hypothetical protein
MRQAFASQATETRLRTKTARCFSGIPHPRQKVKDTQMRPEKIDCWNVWTGIPHQQLKEMTRLDRHDALMQWETGDDFHGFFSTTVTLVATMPPFSGATLGDVSSASSGFLKQHLKIRFRRRIVL